MFSETSALRLRLVRKSERRVFRYRVSFVDESDFQNERKWYILSKNSQFKECSIVPLDINGSLAGISDFGEYIVSEAGSASGGISSHDGSKNDTDSVYNTETSIISTISSSFNRKKL